MMLGAFSMGGYDHALAHHDSMGTSVRTRSSARLRASAPIQIAELLALLVPYERTLAEIGAAIPPPPAPKKPSAQCCGCIARLNRVQVEKEVGSDVVEARYERALDANSVVIEEFYDMLARTLEGLIFKALSEPTTKI